MAKISFHFSTSAAIRRPNAAGAFPSDSAPSFARLELPGRQPQGEAAVDFGASDVPMRSGELAKLGLGQFPIVIGGVVVVVNLEGVDPGQIRFTGPVLANVFLGRIDNWADPAIKALNPNSQAARREDRRRPPLRRLRHDVQFHRLPVEGEPAVEGEGRLPTCSFPGRPAGGAKRNERVCADRRADEELDRLRRIRARAAGEAELSRLIPNRAGKFAAPTSRASRPRRRRRTGGKRATSTSMLTDVPGEDAYPMVATVFVLMQKEGSRHRRVRPALEFLRVVAGEGRRRAPPSSATSRSRSR